MPPPIPNPDELEESICATRAYALARVPPPAKEDAPGYAHRAIDTPPITLVATTIARSAMMAPPKGRRGRPM